MARARINAPVGGRRKQRLGMAVKRNMRTGAAPAEAAVGNVRWMPVDTDLEKTGLSGSGVIGRLIDSMNLDEMLEASEIADRGIRGELIPTVTSPKVQKYVGTVLQLNKRPSTKSAARKMQQNLTVQIVERNKKTTNAAEARRLYRAFMDED